MSKEDKKRIEVYKYSNPNIVFEKADRLFGNMDMDYELQLSTRKDKKYMIRGDFTNNQWVHFGQMGYDDFTKHNDYIRRNKFLKRNHNWAYRYPHTPAFLSFTLLW